MRSNRVQNIYLFAEEENSLLFTGLMHSSSDWELHANKSIDQALKADLLVFDQDNFFRFKEKIIWLRDKVKPLFLPLLLLAQSGGKPLIEKEYNMVDDLVYLSGQKEELPDRIRMLLAARKRSNLLHEFDKYAHPVSKVNLTEQDDLIKHAVNLAQVGIYQVDENGYIFYVNDYSCRMTGFSREELLKMRIFELDPEFDESGFRQNRNRIRSTGSGTFITRHKRKDGSSFPVEISVSYFVYREEVLSISMARDISERVAWEEKLIANEERVRRIIEATGAGTWSWDIVNDVLEVNEHWASIIGMTLHDLQPLSFTTWKQLVHPDDFVLAEKELKAHLASENELYKVEIRMQHSSGTWVWVLSTGKVTLRDKEGRAVRMEGTHMDISRRKEAQLALQESREKYRLLVEDINDVLYHLDDTGEIIYVSPSILAMTGYPDEYYSGRKFLDVIYEEDRDRVQQAFLSFFSSANQVPVELRVRKDSGELIWLRTSSKPVYIEGRVAGIRGTAVDISLQKETERLLIAAREQAEESDRLKTAFLSNISHEIRTPMNGILGFAHLLKGSEMIAERREMFLDQIEKSADRMLNLINDLVDISLIDSSEMAVREDLIVLGELMEEMMQLFLSRAERKGISLQYRIAGRESDRTIIADRPKLHTILGNLLKNALKFTEKGEIEYGYYLESSKIRFYVYDTGTGIEEDMEGLIYERFRKCERTPEGLNQGPGLGLSIAKAFIENMGGEISFTSEPGKGTRFHFTLPLREAQVSNEKVIQEKTARLNDSVILVAEDDEVNFMYVRELLGKTVSRLLHADNGVDAVKMALGDPEIDLVLMDIKLPEKNGLEAMKEIKAKRPDLPVVAYTAYARPEDQYEALRYGCDAYLTKPVSNAELLGLLGRLLSQ